MPRKISITEAREWLAEYDKGESIAAIAKKTRHDNRVVAHGVEEARREADARGARAEMIRSALKQHQDDLLEALGSLRATIGGQRLQASDSPFQDPKPDKLLLTQATAARTADGKWAITLAAEATLKWELLEEHLKRDPAWKLVALWKGALGDHMRARSELGRKLVDLLRETTDLEIASDPESESGYLYAPGVQALYAHVADHALGLGHLDLEQLMVVQEGRLYCGSKRALILKTKGSVEDLKNKIVGALERPSLVSDLVASYSYMQETARKANMAIEELILTRIIPGQCRVCRRLGL